MPKDLEFDIVGAVSTTIDADGFQGTQYDAEGEGAAGVLNYETHHFHGTWGRCLDPVQEQPANGQNATGRTDPQKSAQLLVAMDGSQGHAWNMEDPRVVATLPTPLPGEHITYGANASAGQSGNAIGACFTRHHNDGTISRSTTTTGGGPDGQSIFDQVDVGGFTRASPYGTEQFGQRGAWVGYSLSVLGGARFTMGYAAGPVPGVGSYCRWQADAINLVAAAVTIGPAGIPKTPVASATPTAAIFASIGQALTAIVGALNTIPTGGSAASAAAAPFVTQAVGLCSAALAAISTQTAIG